MQKISVRHLATPHREPDLSESFSIREVGEMLVGRDMMQELHRHDFYFMLALKKGSGTHAIDFTLYNITDYSIFFLRPGQVHQLKLNAGCKGYMIQFKTDFYHPKDKVSSQLLRKASTKNFCRLDARSFKKAHAILTSLLEEYKRKSELYQEVMKAHLAIFLIELVRNRKNENSANVPVSPYAQQRLDEFMELLEVNVAHHKQVSYYADRLNLSNYQLNAIAKEMMGKTSSELIDEHIILESRRYLLGTSNQVNQIAHHLGFDDVSYFIRFFKKHTGYSPEAFRQNFG